MHGSGQDIRYGLRGLLKRPAFSGLAAVTLALGIGASTTKFAIKDPNGYLLVGAPRGRRRN
jgi:hypothetical protein